MDGFLQTEFPQRLRRLREQRGLSRRALSELCGLQADAVRKYERQEADPRLSSLIALADYFAISLDELVGYKNIF